MPHKCSNFPKKRKHLFNICQNVADSCHSALTNLLCQVAHMPFVTFAGLRTDVFHLKSIHMKSADNIDNIDKFIGLESSLSNEVASNKGLSWFHFCSFEAPQTQVGLTPELL